MEKLKTSKHLEGCAGLPVYPLQSGENRVYRTEYEYEYYSGSEIWPKANTNTTDYEYINH